MIDKKDYSNLLAKCQHGVTNSNQANELICECYNAIVDLLDMIPDDRTEKQNSSRWVYLETLATMLNDAGIDRVKLLETLRKLPQVDIPNDKDSLYLEYWRPIQKVMYEDKRRLSTVEIGKVYEVMNRHTANTFGISLPWPSNRG